MLLQMALELFQVWVPESVPLMPGRGSATLTRIFLYFVCSGSLFAFEETNSFRPQAEASVKYEVAAGFH